MKYQLVFQFTASGPEDFESLIALEDRLTSALEGSALVDGHDFGSGEANIFLLTDQPDPIFGRCMALIARSPLSLRGAAYRELHSDTYERLWPQEASAPFGVA